MYIYIYVYIHTHTLLYAMSTNELHIPRCIYRWQIESPPSHKSRCRQHGRAMEMSQRAVLPGLARLGCGGDQRLHGECGHAVCFSMLMFWPSTRRIGGPFTQQSKARTRRRTAKKDTHTHTPTAKQTFTPNTRRKRDKNTPKAWNQEPRQLSSSRVVGASPGGSWRSRGVQPHSQHHGSSSIIINICGP